VKKEFQQIAEEAVADAGEWKMQCRALEREIAEKADALEAQAREIEHHKMNCLNLHFEVSELRDELAALKAQPSGVPSALIEALKYYANGDHLLLADPDAWDTCSGEPLNFLHDDAGTASVEDGSIAKAALESLNQQPASAGDERAAFEAACQGLGLALYAGSDCRYATEIQCAWMLWQARAALSVRESVPDFEKIKSDAARYQFLKENCQQDVDGYRNETPVLVHALSHAPDWRNRIDRSIDAAIAAAPSPSGNGGV
jgi:hypothetical protein